MRKPIVAVTQSLPSKVEAELEQLFQTRFNRSKTTLSTKEILKHSEGADVLVPTITDDLDYSVIVKLPTSVRLIANFGAGIDHIDCAAAEKRGIAISNTPRVLTEDTADLAFAFLLSLPRRLIEGERVTRMGRWSGWEPTFMLGTSFYGKNLGIIGMGRIGQAVARRAAGFGVKVHYHNRNRLERSIEEKLDAEWWSSLDDMLGEIDFLTVHCPLSNETKNLLNLERLSRLRPHVVVVNTARGGIIDEEALADLIEAGKLAGAGLDVYENEPKIHSKLLQLDNVLTLPHLGSATHEARNAMGRRVIENIIAFAKGQPLPDGLRNGKDF